MYQLNRKSISHQFSGYRSFSIRNFLRSLISDPRVNQILYLSSFLLFGVFWLDWSQDIGRYTITFSVTLLSQFILLKIYGKDISSLKSAMISALGLCLLFKANAFVPIALASFLTIAGKFLIKYKGKHVFNPNNFGIVMAILLTQEGWISPGQWGNSEVLLGLILITGINILLKVGRMETSIFFLLTYLGMHFGYNILYKGWPLDFFMHQITSGTLLLFAFFMITDPVTTPNSVTARIIWSAMVGVLSFFLTQWFYVHTAPIYALFLLAPFTVLFDRIFISKRFKWKLS